MESVLPFANIVARDARSTVQSLNAEPQSWGEGGKAKSQSCESLWDQDSRSCLYNGRIAPWEARMSLMKHNRKVSSGSKQMLKILKIQIMTFKKLTQEIIKKKKNPKIDILP